ncbi:hypothetical protein IZU99_00925 [Oscillospiraceae bacterium CM]|nr:hypothetical protein IZU99_00925 [Oscillospiraceae bacterium CM]
MLNYEKLYRILFNGISDAINALDLFNYGVSRDILVKAQQSSEEAYIEEAD